MTNTQKWDRYAVGAEVRRRGLTLTGIAIEAGLYAGACRQGLIGNSRAGAEAIAAALDIPFRVLFPDQYVRGRHKEGKHNERCGASANAPAPADTAQAAE